MPAGSCLSLSQVLFLLCVCAGLQGPALALAAEVRDPSAILPRMGSFLNSGSWNSAVKCGERQSFYRVDISCEIKCSTVMCASQCTPAAVDNRAFDLVLEECTSDSVAIYGTNNFSGVLSKSEFLQTGTWIHALLRSFDHFVRPTDSLTLLSGYPRSVTLIENGVRREETGFSVSIEHRTLPNVMAQRYEMVFLPGKTLLASLVYFSDESKNYFLKKKGVAGVR